MRKFLKNKIVINFISAVLFGIVYSLLTFIDKGYINISKILISTVSYFIIMRLFYFIASKLRNTDHDIDNL